MAQINLSHEEIWDDSALINSWNDALEEYKKYHCIHANGGSLEDLEKAQRSSDSLPSENVEANGDQNPKAPETKMEVVMVEPTATTTTAVPSTPTSPKNITAPGPPPQLLLNSIRDENLKKLLMSWYYAGYYTGLYEGQQQQQQQQQPSTS